LLDGQDTEAKVRRALDESMTLRMGPVHIALPSDVGRTPSDESGVIADADRRPQTKSASRGDIESVATAIGAARRPVLVVGLDVNPKTETGAVRAFVARMGMPTFVTPKAKGIVSEDHALFAGVCAGVAGDPMIVEFLESADLLVGVGFEPVESDKLWHHTCPLVAVGPVSIAAGAFRPRAEAIGDLAASLAAIADTVRIEHEWHRDEVPRLRQRLHDLLRPAARPRGLSGYELTRALRALMPRDTILATDVGSIKSITSQAWEAYEPLTFFESNGLSSMSYSFPAAMAARLQFPDRPILCTIGDGGFGMTHAELETCVRERLHFITVVYNDNALSLIDVAQQNRGYPTHGVKYGDVDFSIVASGFGAWSRHVESMEALEEAVREGQLIDGPVVIDAVVDPAEYVAHHPRQGGVSAKS
jgi:acetolactate synthase-1/2/3 large subunit